MKRQNLSLVINLKNKVMTKFKRSIYYGRVSTKEQNLARQLSDEIQNNFTPENIFLDKISGSKAFENRPAGKQVLELVKAGQIKSLTVHSLDRFGRNLADIQKNLKILEIHNVNFISVKEGLKTLNDDGSKNRPYLLKDKA